MRTLRYAGPILVAALLAGTFSATPATAAPAPHTASANATLVPATLAP